MGKYPDALVKRRIEWIAPPTPPVPWRLQGDDPLIHPDELVKVAENLMAGRPFHMGLEKTISGPTQPLDTSARLNEMEVLSL